MKTLSAHLDILGGLRTAMASAIKAHDAAALELVREHGKHREGQELAVPRAACVHEGKRCRITRVLAKRGYGTTGYFAAYQAVVLKADGSDSSYTVDWREPVEAEELET